MGTGGGGGGGLGFFPRCDARVSLFLPVGILNFCANNYLGLSSHPEVIRAAVEALEKFGAGLSSVRFICGTQVLGTGAASPAPGEPFSGALLRLPSRRSHACTMFRYTWPGRRKNPLSPR